MDGATLEQILTARQPNPPELRLLAAMALMRMGSWEGANAEYRVASTLDPANRSSSEPTTDWCGSRNHAGPRLSGPRGNTPRDDHRQKTELAKFHSTPQKNKDEQAVRYSTANVAGVSMVCLETLSLTLISIR